MWLPVRVLLWALRSPRRREMDALGEFLAGDNTSRAGLRFRVTDRSTGRCAVLHGGDYELLYRLRGDAETPVYLLNMDHPIANLPIRYWRRRTLAAAKGVGVELLPLSERAYRRAIAGNHHPHLVAREGYEAVFTLADIKTGEQKYFLSGYDQQEKPPLYFLCQLPHAVSSIGEARPSLQPPSVKTALHHGVEVRRQGDLFFISTSLSDDDIRVAGGEILAEGPIAAFPYITPLYGTAHTASRVARLPGGVMLARGIVRHAPSIIGQSRKPDHSDLVLGTGWWLVARNTVPAKRGTGSPVSWASAAPFSNPFQQAV